MEEVSTEDFYNTVQGCLYEMDAPTDLVKKANIGAGDKLAVTIWEQNGKVCCISLIKAEDLTEMVKGMLGPVMKEIL